MKFSRLALVAFIASSPAWSQSPETASTQDQQGPTILSRADMQLPPDGTAEGKGRNYANFFLFVNGFYNTGVNSGDGGWQAGGGVNLAHALKRGILSLSYSGGYRDFTAGNNSSTFQNLALSFNYKLSKRWLMALRQNIQILPQGIVVVPVEVGNSGPIGLNSGASQQQFYVTSASFVYQQSQRWSYEFGGDIFYANYHPDTYFNSHGFGGSASANYRKSIRTTLGVGYQYYHYVFSGNVGQSSTNTVFGSYSRVFSPGVQLGLSVGGSRTDISQTGTTAEGLYTYTHVAYSPFVNARFSKAKRNYTFSLLFLDGVNSGNGAYASSKALNAGGGVLYTINRKVGVSGQVGYSRLQAIPGPLSATGTYDYVYLTGGFNYKMSPHIGASFAASYYDSTSQIQYGANNSFYISAGLIFTSEDRPVLIF